MEHIWGRCMRMRAFRYPHYELMIQQSWRIACHLREIETSGKQIHPIDIQAIDPRYGGGRLLTYSGMSYNYQSSITIANLVCMCGVEHSRIALGNLPRLELFTPTGPKACEVCTTCQIYHEPYTTHEIVEAWDWQFIPIIFIFPYTVA